MSERAAQAECEHESEGQAVRAAAIEAALKALVALKDGPRDEVYEQLKQGAWEAAREALNVNVDDAHGGVSHAFEAGVRQAMTWLRAGYEYGSGPEWRENGAEWIADRLADHTRNNSSRPNPVEALDAVARLCTHAETLADGDTPAWVTVSALRSAAGCWVEDRRGTVS